MLFSFQLWFVLLFSTLLLLIILSNVLFDIDVYSLLLSLLFEEIVFYVDTLLSFSFLFSFVPLFTLSLLLLILRNVLFDIEVYWLLVSLLFEEVVLFAHNLIKLNAFCNKGDLMFEENVYYYN